MRDDSLNTGRSPITARPEDLAEVEAIVARSGTSFGLGMRILTPPRRAAMHAVYAFCRAIDDIADEPAPVAEKRAGLAAWRAEIAALYAGRPGTAIGRALLRPVAEYHLPESEFLLLIEGMEWDAEGPIIAPDMARLRAYCRRVAGAVGQLSMPIFGAPPGEASGSFAVAMGEGLQLTNITRDVAEDAGEGRLYLPRELLVAHDIAPEPMTVPGHPALPAARAALAGEAQRAFAAADLAARDLPFKHIRPALVMKAIYSLSLRAMIRDGFRSLDKPKIPAVAKLMAGFAAFAGWGRG